MARSRASASIVHRRTERLRGDGDGDGPRAGLPRSLVRSRQARVEGGARGGGRAGASGGKREGGGDDDGGSPGPSRRELLAAGRVALALAPREGAPGSEAAEAAARRCLRAAVVSPFARAAPLFGRPAAEAAEKAAFFASVMSVLGGGGDDDPGEAPLPPAPAAAAVSRFEKMAAVRAEYPARLNLAGGWTDTPPYSLERRGVVLHVPVLTAYCGDDGTVGSPPDGAPPSAGPSRRRRRDYRANPVWSGWFLNQGLAFPVGGRSCEALGSCCDATIPRTRSRCTGRASR